MLARRFTTTLLACALAGSVWAQGTGHGSGTPHAGSTGDYTPPPAASEDADTSGHEREGRRVPPKEVPGPSSAPEIDGAGLGGLLALVIGIGLLVDAGRRSRAS
ncbi:MAG: hypothetical protein L6Q99_17900 [Planctomycetes bacterium]|nr:hypothetical protein [Planctomycetota bacterium]